MLRRQAAATLVDEKRCVNAGPATSRLQPDLQCLKGFAADWHTAPLFTLAQHMRFCCININPATRCSAGPHVKPHQFANSQPATIKQLGDAPVARFKLGINPIGLCLKACQLNSFVHTKRFGQRLGRFRRAHTLHRVGGHQPFAAQPGVEAAPA